MCKFALGVKSSTLNNGIYAELGRYSLLLCRKISMLNYVLKLNQTDDCRYAKKNFQKLAFDDEKGHYNWVSDVTEMLRTNDLSDGNLSKNRIKSRLVTNYNEDLFDRLQKFEEGRKLRTYK